MVPGNKEVKSRKFRDRAVSRKYIFLSSVPQKRLPNIFKKGDNIVLLKRDLMKAEYSFKQVSQCKMFLV